MKLIPAIDLRDGKVVRLHQGDFSRQRDFAVDPLALAQRYRDAGADWLHAVDLDGARAGAPRALAVLSALADTGIQVQWGGGIRCRADLDAVLAAGASRVVLGSVAVRQPAQVTDWLQAFGSERIGLALDLHADADAGDRIAIDAWQTTSDCVLDTLLSELVPAGARHVLSTDIGRDGMAAGPNLDLYRRLQARWPQVAWIASGGVRNEADLRALADTGVAAAVAGTALLDGSLPLSAIGQFTGVVAEHG